MDYKGLASLWSGFAVGNLSESVVGSPEVGAADYVAWDFQGSD